MFSGNNYNSSRINCAFEIIQEPGTYVKLNHGNLAIPCETSFFEIRDGPYEDSPLMGRFCNGNHNWPPNFTSSQNHVVIRLVVRFILRT